jgi:hypothetical protein
MVCGAIKSRMVGKETTFVVVAAWNAGRRTEIERRKTPRGSRQTARRWKNHP